MSRPAGECGVPIAFIIDLTVCNPRVPDREARRRHLSGAGEISEIFRP